MICVERLSKFYGNYKALDRVSFTIKEGSLVGLLGANGAGKTTLMDVLAGVTHYQEGAVSIDGEMVGDSLSVKEKLGYLPDQPPLYLDMTVSNYLRYVGILKRVTPERINQRVEDVLGKLELEDYAQCIIEKLSKGYRQRVGIAQALINNPKILILDEPTVALDPRQRAQVKDLVKSLKRDHTILLSTHILSDVEDICDEVVLISEGKLKTRGSLESLSKIDDGGETIFHLSLSSDVKVKELFLIDEVKDVKKISQKKWQISFMKNENERSSASDRYLEILARHSWGIREYVCASKNLENLFFTDENVK